ncbi:nucleotidyltransferase domain-containing protein [Actinomyces viscosus]|uniref:nucleotidyltransferase family protein n=1 Tax=Actinomyces viscosus TaxID=1656 RepID=UPI0028E67A41|nr:nucleotidyltransferase domain-containing protein [Actinomyces viscosus]
MSARVAIDAQALSAACARFGVARLRLFGSVLTDRFDPHTSDIDFLVDFQAGREDRFADFFGLQDELTRIFGGKIDLIVAESVKNPYFKASMLQNVEDVYAA